MATTAKQRLMAMAATMPINNRVEGKTLEKPRLSVLTQKTSMPETVQQEPATADNRQKVLTARQKGLGTAQPAEKKTPVSDRAKRVAAIRAGLKTEAEPGKLTKAGQSLGLNTAGSVEYLLENAKQSRENTRNYLQSEGAQDYAAAVSEFNRIRKYYDESAPEYQAALEQMELAKAGAQKAEADARSVAVDQNSRAAKLMGESRRLQEEALEGTTGAGRFLGETALSMAGTLSKLPLGAAAPVLMGAEAAANKAYDLGQQGVGANQALLRGVGSGVIESITEKVPLDNLLSLVKTGGKSALNNILKQGGIEATEEGLSYLMNLIADKAAKDPNAQFSLMELAKSAGGGLISGLAFGAGGTVAGQGANRAPDVIAQTGNEKQAPREGSLHLKSESVVGLPMREIETAEPRTLPMAEKENTVEQSQAVKKPPYDLEKVDKEYLSATNNKIVEFIQAVKNKTAWKGQKIVTGTVNDRLGAEIKSLTGIDLSGKEHRMNTNAVEHILRRHGENGKADHSMQDPNDIARVQWVLDHYDGIRKGDQSGGYKNKDGSPAIPIEVYKKIDGTYYVVEAVVDAQSGYLGMVSAYINKKDAGTASSAEAYQVSDAEAPNHTSKTELELTPNNTVPQTETPVKPSGLPMRRQESLQNAMEASLQGGRTLGDRERKTGVPLPTEVGNQLQAVEMLSGQLPEDKSQIANTIRKYVGEDAALYWLEKGDEGFDDVQSERPTPERSGAVTDEEGNVIGTEATEKLGVRIEGSIANMGAVQKAREAQWGLDVTERQIREAERQLRASPAEKRMAENVAKGIDTLDSYQYGWDGKDNRRRSVVEELSALYRLRDTYDRNGVKALGRKNKDRFIDTLNREILNRMDEAKPPMSASLWTNTWERNNLRTWGKELGQKVNALIFDPIRRNEAQRIRWLNDQIDSIPVLAELTEEENKAVFDMLDAGKNTADYSDVRNEKVQEAAEQLRQRYSDYYDAINDVLVAHGYPEIGFIKNYAPHTQQQEENLRKAMNIFEKLGLSETVNELPTAIAGRTDVFKPGKKWDPHFLHRTGEKSAKDAVGGYLSYVNYLSEVLHHVDDIQKVRTFGDQIRYMYGDEGLKADYDAIRADTSLNEQERETELEKLRERQIKNSKMGGYVTALDDYANILAGKQSDWDRPFEKKLERKGLNLIQKPIQTLVRSSIPGNLSSAINQTVQLPWLTAEAGEGNVIQAALELASGKLKQAELSRKSDFLTGKRGAESLEKLKGKTAGEKVLDIASIPFEAVDDAVSQVIVRAFQLKNIKAGMDPDAALREADKQAERLVGSRMKGAKPDIFSAKSLKLLTTFQLEVANQWQHLKFDLPQEFRTIAETKGKNAAVTEASKRILKGTLYTFALNSLIEQITGNRPAGFDIIGTIWDYVTAGMPDEEDEEQGFDPFAGLGDAASSVAEDIPFVGNIGAMLGFGDGRLPLPSLDWETMGKGVVNIIAGENEEEKKAGWEQLGTGALTSAAAVVPMGNQIKKTIQGTTDVVRGGRYSKDGKKLLYEVEQSPMNYARGILFGRNALPETREYWDEGGKNALSEKQTELMQQASAYGVDQGTYVEYVTQAKKLQGDKDAEGNTVDGSLERKKIELLNSMDLTDEQRMKLYLDNVASDSRKEAVTAMGAAGMTWGTIAPAITSYLNIGTYPGNATDKATRLAAWADQNLNSRQANVVKEELDFWQMMPAEAASYEKLVAAGLDSRTAESVNAMLKNLQPAAGKEQVSQSQKLRAVADNESLSEENKKKAVSSILSADSLGKYEQCMAAGISVKDYVDVKLFYGEAAADKDKNGNSVSGSKKKKVWAYINTLDVSPAQKDQLSILCTYDSDLDEAPWNTGAKTLPGVSGGTSAREILGLPMADQKETGGTNILLLP